LRALITGGTGFLGGFLLRRMLTERCSPRVLARPGKRADALAESGVDVCRGDLADPKGVASAVASIDTVFHCGAQVAPDHSWQRFVDGNVRGTQLVLEASVRAGVKRFVYTSSLGVYGVPAKDTSISEQAPLDARPELRGHYSHSKILAERSVLAFQECEQMPITVFRPGCLYGPGRRPPAGLLAFQKGSVCWVLGRRDTFLPLSYVENVVDALLLAARSESAGFRIYNLVDDSSLTQERYVDVKSELISQRTIFLPSWPLRMSAAVLEPLARVVPVAGMERFSRHALTRALYGARYETRRVREELGWAPRVGLREALRLTYASEPAGTGNPGAMEVRLRGAAR
jgi:nucleoside-diphosphate-sugar epimerase